MKNHNPPIQHRYSSWKTYKALLFIIVTLSGIILSSQAEEKPHQGSPNDFRKKNKRGPETSKSVTGPSGTIRMGIRSVEFPEEFRTIDGSGNNSTHLEWGATEIPFLRKTTVDYADGVDAPSGAERPNARAISNAVCAQEYPIFNRHGASDYLWQWGQFLDHDITLTPISDISDPFNIKVPSGDPYFDPQGSGTVEISLDRSYNELIDGVREQLNEITAYIDASNVYGSDTERAEELRQLDGSGQLKSSKGNLLPFNVNGLPNAPSDDAPDFFLAGDFRANEQSGLTAMHTLFMREHNYWAKSIAKANSSLNGDQIYQLARSIVGAEIQIITYREFLPFLLGPKSLPPYQGYRDDVNPGISNVFASASYRFGHSMLSASILRLDRRLEEIDEGHLDLASAFFNPDAILNEGGIDPILRGLAHQPAQEIDTLVVNDVRNFLFGPPGAGGLDLAALNIQRGRDHGLPGYNEVRRNFGLPAAISFSDITPDVSLQQRLAAIYGDIEKVDAWVGGLAEPHLPDALVGETNSAVLRDQFLRLRDGDRFWYQNHLNKKLQKLLESQTLSKIIHRNTKIGRELPTNVFVTRRPPTHSKMGAGHGPPPSHRGNDKRRRR
ncbi:MAG: peroxidase family protein [Verrucomicrobiota bacterium]